MTAFNILQQISIGVKDGLIVSAILVFIILVSDFIAELLLQTDFFLGI